MSGPDWAILAVGCMLSPLPWILYQLLSPAGRAFGTAARSFVTSQREVWLTIDDGPDPVWTPQVLDLLDHHGARATFFLIGARVERFPEWAREIVRRGHAVANHTMTHGSERFWCASPGRLATEIDGTESALRAAGLTPAPWFRPPIGIRNPRLRSCLDARGLKLVLWSIRGFDGAGSRPEAALRRVLPGIRPGAILLAHEGGRNAPHRMRFLTLLLERLTADGYRCVLPAPDSLQYELPTKNPR